MATENYSGGPTPPAARPAMDMVPPMPPSILAAQGQQQGQQQGELGTGGALQKETLQMALQKLLEYRNAVESLVTTVKAVDPESIGLMIPAIEVGKAIESRLQQATQRAANPSPSMAGMMGGAGPGPQSTSVSGM